MLDTTPPSDQERAELKSKNLDAFKKYNSRIRSLLDNHRPGTKLVFDEAGQPDIIFEGQRFYDGRYFEIIDEQSKAFENNRTRFNLSIPQPNEIDSYGATFLHDVISRATVDNGIEFIRYRTKPDAFFAVVFGIGLGGHLKAAAEISKCKHLMLIDPNIETLYHSLEVFDWEELFDMLHERRGTVEFIIANDPYVVFETLKFQLRILNAPGIDGTQLFDHYNNTVFVGVKKSIAEKNRLMLAGLGFFLDEKIMIKNTHANLSKGGAHIYHQNEGDNIQVPCFIVGCGPSLDHDLPYIKKNAANAIVISSGSALGPLLNAGITPDFQIEVENDGILPIMEHVAQDHALSDICLVTSSTVEAGIVKYFDRIIYHFRPALSPYGIFSDDPKNTIPFHDPSVVNSSFGFAQDIGFKEFYLFGCDMGTRDANMHHAKNSYHFTEGAHLPDNDFCIPLPANFGGQTMTSQGLFWVKECLENAITSKPVGRTYYNCTDGAFIQGTISKLAKRVSLKEITDPNFKRDFVKKTLDRNPVMTRERFNELWNTEKVLTTIDDCMERIKTVIENANFVTDNSYQIDMNHILFHSPTALQRGVSTLFRGTLQMALMSTEFYANRLKDDEDAENFETILREELFTMCDTLQDEAVDLVKSLDDES
ncbi:DUF115 domain-containing protein [Thalassospiraceae bacterium LMO-JJ14]|nr:DUF115 domain-containing protein [Thalassospiraceae bacterium LMO-JJ14]